MEKNDKLIEDEMSEKIIQATRELALSEGSQNVTVSKVLRYLGITNRVFYNRFHNIDEVLLEVYHDIFEAKQELISKANYESADSYFEEIEKLLMRVMDLSYRLTDSLGSFIFEQDSVTNESLKYWQTEIGQMLKIGMERGYIEEVNAENLAYAIWCFVRGFNADAVSRNLPQNEAWRIFGDAVKVVIKGLKRNS